MMALIQFNLATLATAMAIGLVTGWWMFARRAGGGRKPEDPDQP